MYSVNCSQFLGDPRAFEMTIFSQLTSLSFRAQSWPEPLIPSIFGYSCRKKEGPEKRAFTNHKMFYWNTLWFVPNS